MTTPMKIWQPQRSYYKVSDFITWAREKALVLNPDFQRRSVWKPGAKSYLIDTIMRGLPIPVIFLREPRTELKTLKSSRDVVDGQQRIRTILSFIVPEVLSDFDAAQDAFVIRKSHNALYGGKSFRDLPDTILRLTQLTETDLAQSQTSG